MLPQTTSVEEQQVILVDEKDLPLGSMEKMEAHEKGLLHRAFSVFIFNHEGEMLLQRRALHKYHSGGLWTNSCCSHPRPGEEVLAAAQRRLQEELGFVAPLEKLFDFVYRAEFHNGLVEHEFDHVFVGKHDGPVKYNEEEVMDYCYRSIDDLKAWLSKEPGQFTEWFQLAFPRIEAWWRNSQ
jgi:isopentenyl-diphosphate delta-isomerase